MVSLTSASTRYVSPIAHLVDVALTTAVGVAVAIALAGARALVDRVRPGSRFLEVAVIAAVHAPVAVVALGDFCDRRAHALASYPLSTPLRALFVASVVVAPALTSTIARALVRPRGRIRRRARREAMGVLLALLVAALAATLNGRIARAERFEVHAAVVWCIGLWLAEVVDVKLARRSAPRRGPVILAALFGLLLVAVALVPPSSRVRSLVFRAPSALGGGVFASLFWSVPPLPGSIADALNDQAAPDSRTEARPIVDGQPIVILVTIGSFRADALLDAHSAERLPNLSELAREGVVFTNAHASSNERVRVIASLFAGKLPSAMQFRRSGDGPTRGDWPDDTTPRLASLLEAAGVETTSILPTPSLGAARGVAAGFGDERLLAGARGRALAPAVMRELLAKLDDVGSGPRFLYAHFADALYPYAAPTRERAPRERWRAALGAIDEQWSALRAALATDRLRDRVVLLIAGDHGEDFGEHAFVGRSRNLYEEMLRVPIIVVAPHVTAHGDGALVGTLDLAPTILELFHVDVPAAWTGHSLVPLVLGRATESNHVLVAESANQRAFLLGDEKVIVDERSKSIASFDLVRDPSETAPLFAR